MVHLVENVKGEIIMKLLAVDIVWGSPCIDVQKKVIMRLLGEDNVCGSPCRDVKREIIMRLLGEGDNHETFRGR